MKLVVDIPHMSGHCCRQGFQGQRLMNDRNNSTVKVEANAGKQLTTYIGHYRCKVNHEIKTEELAIVSNDVNAVVLRRRHTF